MSTPRQEVEQLLDDNPGAPYGRAVVRDRGGSYTLSIPKTVVEEQGVAGERLPRRFFPEAGWLLIDLRESTGSTGPTGPDSRR